MYHLFNPLLHINNGTNAHIHHYLSLKENGLTALSCYVEYAQKLQSHIHFIKCSIQSIQQQVHELTTYLSDKDVLPAKSFSLYSNTYHSHINSDSYFLFSPMQYDSFIEKHAFSIFEIDVSARDKIVQQCSLGFSSSHLNDLVKYPFDLKDEIEKFDAMQTIEQSKEHLLYCQKQLMYYFDVDEVIALYDIEESLLLKYIGDPLVLLRIIQKKHNDNRIKLSLSPLAAHQIDAAVIELIHLERRVFKQQQLRKFLSEEDFLTYTKQLQQKKARMMNALNIKQEHLDILMGNLPADFL